MLQALAVARWLAWTWMAGILVFTDTEMVRHATVGWVGAWHRLAAPPLGGTMLTIDDTHLAVGGDLTAVPTWTWLALGGGALPSTAVLIERTGRPGSPELRALMSRWH